MNELVVANNNRPAWNIVIARLVRSVLFCSLVAAIWLYVQRKTGVDPGTAALIPCFPGWGMGIGLLFGRWRLGLGLSILILLVLYFYGWGLYFLASSQA
jgi:hypothetical protein